MGSYDEILSSGGGQSVLSQPSKILKVVTFFIEITNMYKFKELGFPYRLSRPNTGFRNLPSYDPLSPHIGWHFSGHISKTVKASITIFLNFLFANSTRFKPIWSNIRCIGKLQEAS